MDEDRLREDDDVRTASGRTESASDAPRYDPSASTRRIDTESVRRFYSGNGSSRRLEWDDDEDAPPKPRFDFSDLKFGTNYSDDDDDKK